ncbi:Tripeptidyl-peptidase sed2 [Exophiala dermatitidis]
MFVVSLLLATLVALQSVAASPVHSRFDYAVKESHNVPPKWTKVGNPLPVQHLKLKIGLTPNNFDHLERLLHQVSDPSHHRYGHHLSQQQVHDLITPSNETTGLIEEWLSEHGIDSCHYQYNAARDWITLTLPVAQVERLLHTKYSVYQHQDGSQLVRTTEWSLPRSLHEHVTTIQPTTAFLRANPRGETVLTVPTEIDLDHLTVATNASSLSRICNFAGMTTKCLSALYNTHNYTVQASDKNQVGFTNYLGQVSSRDDAKLYLQNFKPEAINSSYAVNQVSVNNGPLDNATAIPGVEGNLDLQTILGLVYPTPVTLYSTGGSPPFDPDTFTTSNTNEPYLTWVLYMREQDRNTLPSVISTSYGDDEQTVPEEYAKTVCNQFAALGAQGISLFFSSGDYGVGGNDSCISNDGQNRTTFLPAFPASCPYVTAVGGTRDLPEVVAYDPRNGYASGSGFSNYFTRPSWQDTAVERYFDSAGKQLEQFQGLYNATGRAYPDLAAQSYRYLVFINSTVTSVDGTSCAAPTIAGIFALVNDALAANGKPPLGWLNPWLYQQGFAAFTDVVNGSSVGCNGPGFSAAEGWDVASGFGTPDFEKILEVLEVGNGSES